MKYRSAVWFGLVLTAASCVQILDGAYEYAPHCVVDGDCDDENPCTVDRCLIDKQTCEFVPDPNALIPDKLQTAADCKRVICSDGAPVGEEDAQDFVNDNNSCTTDACTNGAPTNEILADGVSCTQGVKTGQCNMGTCQVSCANNNDCEDGNPCRDDFCNTSTSQCVYTNIDGIPTPGATPIVGDCKLHVCNNGLDVEINDDADVLVDNNPCTTDTCAAGAPINPAVPERTLCVLGDVKVCDSTGNCVECVVAEDCVNITETECEKRSCVNNLCQIAYEGQGTLASPVLQAASDCQKVVCNGPNGTTTINDDSDLPNDSNPCTKDICSNGAPMNPPEATNFACGASQVCNGLGQCVGCTDASQCAGMDDFCKTRTCNANVCGVSNTPNGTDLPTASQTAGDCKVVECNGMGGIKTSALQSDVPVDGNACTQDLCSTQGNPSNPATAANSPCSVGANDACDGSGNCKKSLGKVCGAGTECVSALCVDGVCCNATCTADCKACNVAGSLGTCSNVAMGVDDGMCSGNAESCNGVGVCKAENGSPCAAGTECFSTFCVDAFCCNNACTGICNACSAAASDGPNGTCSPVTASTDPGNECADQLAVTCGTNGFCDGASACQKYAAGTTCVAQSCIGSTQTNADTCNGTGTCVDNAATNCAPYTCGASACKTSCTVDGDCSSGNYCAGTMCLPKKNTGQVCTGSNQCTSSFCIDGICCFTACTTTCQACNVAGSAGLCTNLPFYTDDTFPANACTGNNTCNGNGVCKLKNGQSCSGNNQCVSGNCFLSICSP